MLVVDVVDVKARAEFEALMLIDEGALTMLLVVLGKG